ncbi:hypothetical protein T552_02747 [Pneumocystis carinii B80]|uniref:Uncharacterized protein n=1 Tax=Pneumocystis carinii (strain B80) TaxID=1408658 RepID=A0A0W4ZEE4_PNEC8|nr:hypothetical protein T552_02747 [Pneumocystis carinii B80]KTW26743.1 hypothetical protein T552_02747 [Pneumocystis carinii B80]
MRQKVTYSRKKQTDIADIKKNSPSKENLCENPGLNMHITSDPVPPRRTYLRKPIPTKILSDKSNIVDKPVKNSVRKESALLHKQKREEIGNLSGKRPINRLTKPFPLKKTFPEVTVSITKLKKKQPLFLDKQIPISTSKKRNLSTIACLDDSAQPKNNPHIDINDLSANILDELSSFQQLSSDAPPVATSTPKEIKHTKETAQLALNIPGNTSSDISSLSLSTSTDNISEQEVLKLASLNLNTNKPTKQSRNKLKKRGMLVKHLAQPITCDSSLDDEIITKFS